ncbi:hypothetical protein F4781DRAFT_438557 [Annulohypoxylon bovei var. microspora]|nr:hypothetical protein F4781DRAFT_438557 [Annulohypoxylon bovei var. microspora]
MAPRGAQVQKVVCINIDDKVRTNVADGAVTVSTLDRWLDESNKNSYGIDRSGVSFRDLNCYGFVSADQYKSTFATWVFEIPSLLLRVISTKRRQPQRVKILRGLNGLVRPGELLLVLGRPGSGCSTFQVGNAMLRGISGGEKRRASLAEVFVGSAQFQCWDNSTGGFLGFWL